MTDYPTDADIDKALDVIRQALHDVQGYLPAREHDALAYRIAQALADERDNAKKGV